MDEMKVSVETITYNQERFIAQALDSALMQQTNFEYEIVVGEDCSTDRTRDIVVDYQNRYPHKIRAILRTENLGGRMNDVRTLQACRGQYIAMLEGDDFWTSPHKLQRQVDFLDSHPEYVMCFHNARRVGEDGIQELGPYVLPGCKPTWTLKDLLVTNPIPTGSVMFRNGLLNGFPKWYFDVPLGDWATWIFLAHHGSIQYIDEVMGAYRVHGGGVYSRLSKIEQTLRLIEFLGIIGIHLDSKYAQTIKRSTSMWRYRLVREYVEQGDPVNARTQALRCVAEAPLHWLGRTHKVLTLFARLYAPRLYGLAYAATQPARRLLLSGNSSSRANAGKPGLAL